MASYNIVLNLKGNSVSQVERLADALERANRNASSLGGHLRSLRVSNVAADGTIRGGAQSVAGGSLGMMTQYSTGGGFNTTFRLLGRLGTSVGLAVTAIDTAVKFVRRVTIPATVAQYSIGPKLLQYGANVLTSSEMREGIRLLQRRQQARIGFGARYAAAQERADLLAASYGLDPSNTIAAMNVLAGLPIGTTGRRISMYDAERLTQAGGLISQQSGVPFERVMTNIQQMMSQVTPTIRDIREMLNAAPILSKYAMDEMERQGISGVTSMDWLKNQANIMTVLERFMAENPAIAAMQARGIVSRSRTQFYATLADNPDWLQVASRYENLMGSAAKGLSALLSAATGSESISMSINRLVTLFNEAPAIIDKFSEKLDKWVGKILKYAGVEFGTIEGEAQRKTEEELAMSKFVRSNLGTFRQRYQSLGLDYSGTTNQFANRVLRDLQSTGWDLTTDLLTKGEVDAMSYGQRLSYVRRNITRDPLIVSSMAMKGSWPDFMRGYQSSVIPNRANAYASDFAVTGRAGFEISLARAMDAVGTLSRNNGGSTTLGLRGLNGTTPLGDDIGGYGRDRKALIINFNDAIVKWDSTIESSQPQDVVNEVADNIEGITSRAIQVALLGASQKMTTRF